MEIVGYLASVLIGVSLGLIGGGGSILTVPVLVYLFGIGTVQATVYSLFYCRCNEYRRICILFSKSLGRL